MEEKGQLEKQLQELVKEAAESINIIGITDAIGEEYLLEICEKYHEIRLKLEDLPFKSITMNATIESVSKLEPKISLD